MKEYTPVICVTAGDGYEKDKIYPMLGWNNGVHILRANETGDVVDREFCTGGYGKGLFNSFSNEGYPSFDEIPSAQPERKRGEWISLDNDSRHVCSVCRSKEYVPTCMGEPTIWNYCPNCGAYMRGEQDG